MVCTGAKSEEDSEHAAKQYAKMIRKNSTQHKQVRISNFMVQNIVASHYVGFQIRLEEFLNAAPEYSRYEPDCFPGLIFRMNVPKVVLLIFASGKIVLTGAKTRQQIYEAYDKIKPMLI